MTAFFLTFLLPPLTTAALLILLYPSAHLTPLTAALRSSKDRIGEAIGWAWRNSERLMNLAAVSTITFSALFFLVPSFKDYIYFHFGRKAYYHALDFSICTNDDKNPDRISYTSTGADESTETGADVVNKSTQNKVPSTCYGSWNRDEDDNTNMQYVVQINALKFRHRIWRNRDLDLCSANGCSWKQIQNKLKEIEHNLEEQMVISVETKKERNPGHSDFNTGSYADDDVITYAEPDACYRIHKARYWDSTEKNRCQGIQCSQFPHNITLLLSEVPCST